MIKVLVIDDSYFLRFSLARMLNSASGINAFTARNYGEAMQKMKLRPDVVVLSIDMKEISCLDILHEILRSRPTPVIITSSVSDLASREVVTAFEYGAFDFIAKPRKLARIVDIKEELVALVTTAASVEIQKVFVQEIRKIRRAPRLSRKLVVFGASTGGPLAVESILKAFPKEFPAMVLVVQHMPPGFTRTFAERLNNLCELQVKEAEQGDVLSAGRVLIAPGGLASEVVLKGSKAVVRVKKEVSLLSPCIDTALASAAGVFRNNVVAVILTGMGQDGVRGVEEVKKSGGVAIAQDEASSVVFGMPKAVIEHGLADYVLSLGMIPKKIMELL